MKILAISGTRADWGLLQPVLTRLRDDPRFMLEILITGQHLMPNNNSVQEIKTAGFNVDFRVDMLLMGGENGSELCAGAGNVVAGVGTALMESSPDLMLVLGDRYEILGAVTAALLCNVPVAHIAGGDLTEGAFDDAIRHAITKMSSLHFTTTKEAAIRVLQMGESPAQVVVTGSPGIDQLLTIPIMERTSFFESLKLKRCNLNFIVTLHPETLSNHNDCMARAMLSALDSFPEVGLVFTGSNADPGAAELDKIISDWVAKRTNAVFYRSLGSVRYFSALKHCDLVLGNSSSGLYEAASFDIPTVNIGDRQARRVRPRSVIDCPAESVAICKAIKAALAHDWANTENPYGDGQAAARIVSFLATVANPATLIRKSFKDLSND